MDKTTEDPLELQQFSAKIEKWKKKESGFTENPTI